MSASLQRRPMSWPRFRIRKNRSGRPKVSWTASVHEKKRRFFQGVRHDRCHVSEKYVMNESEVGLPVDNWFVGVHNSALRSLLKSSCSWLRKPKHLSYDTDSQASSSCLLSLEVSIMNPRDCRQLNLHDIPRSPALDMILVHHEVPARLAFATTGNSIKLVTLGSGQQRRAETATQISVSMKINPAQHKATNQSRTKKTLSMPFNVSTP